ncbi:hypothetical protein SFRURICE_012018, partial [Spodoptera frugiperda]
MKHDITIYSWIVRGNALCPLLIRLEDTGSGRDLLYSVICIFATIFRKRRVHHPLTSPIRVRPDSDRLLQTKIHPDPTPTPDPKP